MTWKKGQWVKFEYHTLIYRSGLETILEQHHCFYKIKGIQKSKNTLTVVFPNHVFCIDDGVLFYRGEKRPHVGRIVKLSVEDAEWVKGHLSEKPNCFYIPDRST